MSEDGIDQKNQDEENHFASEYREYYECSSIIYCLLVLNFY